MKDRKGPAGRVSGLADGVAAAVRRRQQAREPRIVLFGSDRRPRVLAPGDEAHADLVEVAGRMIDLVTAEVGAQAEAPEPEGDLPPLMVEDAQLFPGPGFDESDHTGRRPRRGWRARG